MLSFSELLANMFQGWAICNRNSTYTYYSPFFALPSRSSSTHRIWPDTRSARVHPANWEVRGRPPVRMMTATRRPAKNAAAKPTGPSAAAEPRRLPLLLRRAWYGLNQAFRRRIAHLEITPDQFTVLRTLLEHPRNGLTQRELTGLMSSDPNTVASLLERMESAGLLERRPDVRDRRALRIRILPAGDEKYLQARQVAVELQGEVLTCLPERQRKLFLLQLGQIADACRQASERSP